MQRYVEGAASEDQLTEASVAAEQAFQAQRQRTMASVVGPDLAHQAMLNPRGLFALTDLQTAQAAHHAADNDPASLAAAAVWSAATSEKELLDAGYSLIDTVIATADQAAAAADDLAHEQFAQAELLRSIFGNPLV